jgi:hypothetical protein
MTEGNKDTMTKKKRKFDESYFYESGIGEDV